MSRFRTVAWTVAAGLGLALGIASAAASAGTPVEARQAAMKEIGLSMKGAGAYMAPDAAYDAAKVKALMDTMAADAKKLKGLFPANSAADPKNAADPKVWQNRADFDKRLAALGTAAKAAAKAKDIDTFKPAFKAVGETCKACHDVYRMKKKT